VKEVVSYGIEIKDAYDVFRPTIKYYRRVVIYLLPIVKKEFFNITGLQNQEAMMYIEHKIHTTKNHPAVYPSFDRKFHKLPSYLRRAAIASAIGKVRSYYSNLQNWFDGGKKGGRPKMDTNVGDYPTFFKKNMFEKDDTYGYCYIKLRANNDWVWRRFRMDKSDMKYIERHLAQEKPSTPVLCSKGKRFELRFAYEIDCSLPDIKTIHRVCAVDLGINSAATCSIMEDDGTVIARKFITAPIEEDRLNRNLEKIKAAQKNGSSFNRRYWTFANNYNRAIAIKTAKEIVAFAKENDAQCIVFEHLNIKGKKNGSKKQRLALWRKIEVQKRTASMAHRAGMRISRVCPYNTSRLAFDGSGLVERDEHNYSLCTFTTGKQYNCDLSASYNIGARYFIRKIKESIHSKKMQSVQAKVPELDLRTSKCTLSTLIRLRTVLV